MEDQLAILILENPWDKPKNNPGRASVLPFVEGICKLNNNISVYYSTFHEINGFDMALGRDLTHTQEKRQILYIASHGNERGLKDFSLRKLIPVIKKYKKIEGILIGACYAGLSKSVIELFEGTNVRWVVSYTALINWFDTTLIDLSILHHMSNDRDKLFGTKEDLGIAFAQAMDIFKPDYKLNTSRHNDSKISSAIQIWGKPKGARDIKNISDDIFGL